MTHKNHIHTSYSRGYCLHCFGLTNTFCIHRTHRTASVHRTIQYNTIQYKPLLAYFSRLAMVLSLDYWRTYFYIHLTVGKYKCKQKGKGKWP